MRRVSCNPLWPSTNQKIQNHLDDQNYAQHRNRIQTAKPAIDNKAPTTYNHLRVKLKKIQIEAERHAKIMEDNILLLKRMSDILHSKGPLGFQQGARPKNKSGIGQTRRNLMQNYETSNDVISKWEEEWQTKLNLISQMTESTKRKTAKTDSKLCPRYIKDFGNQTSEKWILPNITENTRIVGTSPKKVINSCSVHKFDNEEIRKSKSAILPRPKAATGNRKLIASEKSNTDGKEKKNEDENKIPIIFSEQFRNDFQQYFMNCKNDKTERK